LSAVRDCQARRTDFHPSAMSVPTHTGETSSDRIIDRASFIGVLVGCVAYGRFMALFKQTRTHLFASGLHIVLAVACVRTIRRSLAFADYPRLAHVAVAYMVVLFTIATLNIGVKSAEWIDTYIDQRSSPVGPTQYIVRLDSRGSLMSLKIAHLQFTYLGWTSVFSNICTILSLGWISDLVLVSSRSPFWVPMSLNGPQMWRAWVLWNQSIPWIALPLVVVYLANAGASHIGYASDILLTYLALSIADIYGNGWTHQSTYPTLPVSLAYLWMWLGSQYIRCRCS
jgi:hypothetical protein